MLQHDIDVGNAAPIKQHSYRVNAVKRSVMKWTEWIGEAELQSMEFTTLVGYEK